MEDRTLKDQSVLVVGAGRSGVSASRALALMGASVTLTDVREQPADKGDLQQLSQEGISLELGGHKLSSFLSAQRIILSPGVSPTLDPLVEARAKGVPILGELEFAFSFLQGRWVAVTGTNGKSTTTTLIGEMARNSFPSVFVGGNLGRPLSEALCIKRKWDVLVAEVSSFQLETVQLFHPSVAVLLNITPDHMDRYASFEDYVGAKKRLFKNLQQEDLIVANGDDPVVMASVQEAPCSLVLFQLNGKPSRGIFMDGESIVSTVNGGPQEMLSRSDLSLLGDHNVQNVMAAVAVGEALGCPKAVIREAVRKFPGLEHRMETVREINGVRFINDSKGTNVGALKISLGSFSSPVVLIAGGKDKGGAFESIGDLVRQRVRYSILIGEAATRMEEAWGWPSASCKVSNLKEAVKKAMQVAKSGDVVLFSPGCSSYDMFRDFEERGRVFKESVWSL